MADPQGYNLTAEAIRELRRMTAWWRRQPRAGGGGGAPTFPPIPFQFRRFELKDDLTPGGSAEAYMLVWDGSSDYKRKQVNGEYVTFTVYDTVGDKRARGKDSVAEGEDGARGWCVHPHDVDRWEIGEMQKLAKLISGTCEATDADATYTLTSVTALDDGQTPADGDDELDNVLNYSEDMGSGTAICVHDGSGGWRTLDGPCST